MGTMRMIAKGKAQLSYCAASVKHEEDAKRKDEQGGVPRQNFTETPYRSIRSEAGRKQLARQLLHNVIITGTIARATTPRDRRCGVKIIARDKGRTVVSLIDA